MCILFIAIEQHPDYPLIICANRDEFLQRPTLAAHRWDSNIIAGKDLQAGGTWLGVNSLGKFAAVTNLRNGSYDTNNKLSRGNLVINTLQSDSEINHEWLKKNSENYAGFNLIYGSVEQLVCYNSHSKTQQILSKGFHAVCNGPMDDTWPKMAKGKKAMEKQIESGNRVVVEQLFKLLTDQTQAPDEQLPNTGIPYEWEKRLSSIFIQSENYGTRASSIVLYHQSGEINFFENSYHEKDLSHHQVNFTIAR